VGGDRPEQPADEPLRGPAGEPDLATGPGDPDQLVGRALVVGGEHDAQCGQHCVECPVREGEVLGVAVADVDGQTLRVGSPTGHVEQRRDVVDGADVGEPPADRKCHVAGAGRDVEDA
jgi:hypothetical protein